MAGKTRVSALAKQLGVTSTEAVTKLTEMGEYVKSASSTIEGPVARKLIEAFGQQTPERKPAPESPSLRRNVDGLSRWADVTDVIRACRQAEREQKRLELDVGSVRQAFPNTAVPVAAVIQHYKSCGLSIGLANETARLQTMRLTSPLEATAENIASNRIVNVIWTYFDFDQANALAAAVVRHMETTIPMEEGVHQSLSLCLFEVIDNVIEHSGQSTGYFMTTLVSHSTRLAMAISDTGIGAFNSFRGSRYSPRTDFDALTYAIQSGVTSTGDAPRGNGLYTLQRTVESNGGRLELRSGNGHLYIHGPHHGGGERASLPTLGAENRGFFVDWQLDLSTPVRLEDVYQDFKAPPVNHRLEDLEDARERHVVKIREHESGLGTRKSAERLRVYLINMLNLGAPYLVLDFEGVAVVGASFADEVIGKLAEQYGFVRFMQTFQLVNMEPGIELLVNRAISLRMSTERPEAVDLESSRRRDAPQRGRYSRQ